MPLNKKLNGVQCDICNKIILDSNDAWAIASGYINMEEWNGFKKYAGEPYNIVAHTKCFENKYFNKMAIDIKQEDKTHIQKFIVTTLSEDEIDECDIDEAIKDCDIACVVTEIK